MKKTILILFAICLQKISFSQITLDYIYSGTQLYPGCFSTGEKYVVKEDSFGILVRVYIYDLDHSLVKTISMPSQPAGQIGYLMNLSDDLFDTDSTTFEYALNVSVPNVPWTIAKIYREDGTLLFTIDSIYVIDSPSPAAQEYHFIVFQNDDGTFLQAARIPNKKVYVYRLPGKVDYCNACCTAGMFLGGGSGNKLALPALGNASPNPLQHSTNISYSLPAGYSYGYIVIYNFNGAEMKRYQVGSAFTTIEVSADDLSTGTYLYNLQTPDGKSDAKKMIVIR